MFCLCERKEKVRYDATNNEFWTVHRYFTSKNNKSNNNFFFRVHNSSKMHFNNCFYMVFWFMENGQSADSFIYFSIVLFSFIFILLLIPYFGD